MNYLVQYNVKPFDYNREVKLKGMTELREFMLLIPDNWLIMNVKSAVIYNNLQDIKDELLKCRESDIERGKFDNS